MSNDKDLKNAFKMYKKGAEKCEHAYDKMSKIPENLQDIADRPNLVVTASLETQKKWMNEYLGEWRQGMDMMADAIVTIGGGGTGTPGDD